MRLISNLRLLSLALMLTAFGFTGCDKHHDQEITVTIESPADNAVLSNPSATNISVLFEAEKELEEVKVKLYVDASNTAIAPFPIEVHEHKKSHRISETVNLSSYPAGTTFRLEAIACKDHDDNCAENVTKVIRFSLAQ